MPGKLVSYRVSAAKPSDGRGFAPPAGRHGQVLTLLAQSQAQLALKRITLIASLFVTAPPIRFVA